MKEYTIYLKQKYRHQRVVKEHLTNLQHFLKFLENENIEVSDTSYNDLVEYIKILDKKQLKKSTQNNKLRMIKTYFNYLIQKGTITSNPIKAVTIQTNRNNQFLNLLSETQLETIYDNYIQQQALTTLVQKRQAVLLSLIVYQALSSKELQQLLITAVSFTNGTIYISETQRSNERLLKLEAKQMMLLYDYTKSLKGDKLIQGSIRNHLQQLFKNIHPSAQEIRGSRISYWLKQHHLRKAQYLSGFKYISSLEKYRINDVEDLRRSIEIGLGI